MPFPQEHSCRINSPEKYDRFTRQNAQQKSNGKSIDVIFGIKAGKSEIQALRYPKGSWSASEAGAHCRSRKGTFEPALSESTEKEITKYLINEGYKKSVAKEIAKRMKYGI